MESLTAEGFLDINAIDNNPGLGENFHQRRTMMNKEQPRPTLGSSIGFQDRSYSMYETYEQFDRPVLSVCYPPTEPIRK